MFLEKPGQDKHRLVRIVGGLEVREKIGHVRHIASDLMTLSCTKFNNTFLIVFKITKILLFLSKNLR